MSRVSRATGAPAYVASSFWRRLRGLFVNVPEDAVLMIAPCSSIHTFGMKAAIDVAFFDAEGLVVDAYMGLRPWRVRKCRMAAGVLERYSRIEEGPESWWLPGDRITLDVKRKEDEQ